MDPTRLVSWGWPQGTYSCGFRSGRDHSASMVSRCGVIVDTLPYGSVLLEVSLAFMGSRDDEHDMAPKVALVRHPKDPVPPWRYSAELFRRCKDIVLSLSLLGHQSYWMSYRHWHIPFYGGLQTRELLW